MGTLDYHVNETEEWFYQYKGGMLIRMVDGDEFTEYRIEEGEMFLLPRTFRSHFRMGHNHNTSYL